MYNCKDFISNIEKYIDKELTEQEARACKDHLEKCPLCREELTFSISIRDALKEIEFPNSPADFLDRVNAAIDSRSKEKPVRKMLKWRTYSAVAACVILTVALGLGHEKLTDDAPLSGGAELKDLNITSDSSTQKERSGLADESRNESQSGNKTTSLQTETPAINDDTAKSKPAVNAEAEKVEPKTPVNPLWGTPEPTTQNTPQLNTSENQDTKSLPAAEKAEAQWNSGSPKPMSTTEPQTASAISLQEEVAKGSERAASSEPTHDGDAYTSFKSASPEASGSSTSSKGGAGGGASVGGNVTSGNVSALKTIETASISVAADKVAEVQNLAAEYGTRQEDLFEMTESKYKEFLSALKEKGIEYTTSVNTSETVKFEIISK